MKYYIIAGEASGDLHASNLLREIKILDSSAEFRAWGGDLMKEQGAHLVKHYRDLAFMGFAEVLMNLRTIMKNISLCKEDIAAWKPDAVILVDYPGFNLRIAPYVHQLGIPVYYYISPQIWAWKKNRVFKIKENVKRVCCILPFEKDFYAKYDYAADFVGHPLLDSVGRFQKTKAVEDNGRKIIAVLPGSRTQEIKKILPAMIKVSENFPEYRFIIAGAPSQPESFYREVMKGAKMEILFGRTYPLLSQAYAGLITSGTATLEAALFNVPQVVCYTANYISYRIAKYVANVKYISLPNLIMDKEIVKELIQIDFTIEKMTEELRKITENENGRKQMLDNYGMLFGKLGGAGASARTASIIVNELKNRKN
ncbi:MAG: lipid-A-disaccharide synthase [Bacteroidetes bacterium]|nr:lipid-A-disaccharide synthase [Bacteroidota bacterium]